MLFVLHNFFDCQVISTTLMLSIPKQFLLVLFVVRTNEIDAPVPISSCGSIVQRDFTYTAELCATVTALWDSSLLLDVEVSKGTAGSLDDADLLALGWVADVVLIAGQDLRISAVLRRAPAVCESLSRMLASEV